MEEKISAVICTFNEEANIEKCLRSVEGVNEKIVADDGSTDKTVEIAKSLGARVIRRHDHSEKVTKEDVQSFKDRFKWNPQFTEGFKIRNGNKEAWEGISSATFDWVVAPDADEIVTWDLPRIKKETFPIADQISCNYIFSHDEDGTPQGKVQKLTKLFRKSMTRCEGRVHGVIIPNGRIVSVDFMKVDHYPKWDNKRSWGNRSYVLPILEYSVLKDNDSRSKFYLGREYEAYHEYKKAIQLLNEYLISANFIPEIAHARYFKARCHWNIGEGNKAREECKEAVMLNPDFKEALVLMSEMYFEPWNSKWKFIADNATNKDILF